MAAQQKPIHRVCKSDVAARVLLIKWLTDKTMTGVGVNREGDYFRVFGVKVGARAEAGAAC